MKPSTITCDWDNIPFREAMGRILVLWNLCEEDVELYYRESSGGKGFHLKVVFPYGLTFKEKFYWRSFWQDDPRRIWYDHLRTRELGLNTNSRYASGILFDVKDKKECKEWVKWSP